MMQRRLGGCRAYTSATLFAFAVMMGTAGGGCSGGVTPGGSGATDGGSDAADGGDAGQPCPGLGCAPQCPAGVLKDSNGCDTCQCAPVPDAGGSGVCASNADCPNSGICGFLESAG